MRLVWVKVGGLWPVDRGGRLRSFHLVSELSRRHRVTVATTHAEPGERDGLIAALPAPLGRQMMLNHLTEWLRLPDGTVVHFGGEL